MGAPAGALHESPGGPTRLPSATASMCAGAATPRAIAPAATAAPTSPPRLKNPWKLGEHRAPEGRLHRDALRVHGHVERRVRGAEEPEGPGDAGRARREHRQRQRQRQRGRRQERDAPAPASADQPSRRRQDRHGPDRHREEHAPERAVPEAVRRLDQRNVRHPAGQHQPVQEEDRAHGGPGGSAPRHTGRRHSVERPDAGGQRAARDAPRTGPRGAGSCERMATPRSAGGASPPSPVQPVWWLAPVPAPLSPWKYS